ncbi:PAS domain S-box-containing protein [Rhizobacter sp. OV335]|nr:PAS domain S-box-containing protein [Rhizobacter sp. OV335]
MTHNGPMSALPLGQPAVSEPMLRLLFEQSPSFIVVLEGPTHVVTLANPAYQRLVGLDRPLTGRMIAQALPEADEQGFVGLLDAVYASGEPFVGRRMAFVPERAAHLQPETRFVDFVYQPVRGDGERVTGIFVQGHDVTEQVLAERMLAREAEQRAAQAQRFDVTLSGIEDFAYTFDRQLRFTYSNRPLLQLLGITLDEIVGKTFWDLPYPKDLADRLGAEIEQVFVSGERVVGETFYQSPTGVQGWFEYIFNPVFAPDGSVASVAGSTRDVTARLAQERRLAELNASERAARAEAERASRLKDEFLATLSHELRTPLNAILGWTELIRSGRLDADRVREAAERIHRNARAQAQLIADLLDVNRIMTGKIRLAVRRESLAVPVAAALDATRLDAQRKKIALAEPALAGLPEIDGDATRLQQVFWNLLSNSVKFTPEGGTIALGVEADADEVRVKISDNGIGVAADFLPHLFERFSQADSSSTRHHAGLGLGLSICKSLVELHGGRIVAESAGPGRGTSFTVTLPMRMPSALKGGSDGSVDTTADELPPGDELLVLKGASVLVVDDDIDGSTILVTAFAQYGVDAVAADSAEAALALVGSRVFALMLCDIGMPQTDGYALLRQVRRTSGMPAIALTAFARPEDRQRALDQGFSAHIAKPSSPAATLGVCARVLRAARVGGP